jgi:hypothetical protein
LAASPRLVIRSVPRHPASSWQCPECSAFNRGRDAACAACGSPRAGFGAAGLERGEDAQRTLILDDGSWQAPAAREPLWRAALAAAVGLAVLLGTVLVFLALRTEREEVTVAGFEWRRTIEVEACTTVRGESERCLSDRTERARGTDQIPRWPLVRLLPGEREARRSESYVVLLKGRRFYMLELPKPSWSSLREGETRSARIRGGRVVGLN